MLKRTLGLFLLSSSFACGNIGQVELDVSFADADIELRTRGLHIFVRQVPPNGSGCDDLFTTTQTMLLQTEAKVEYPNRNDVVAAPVNLDSYPDLTFRVYALPTLDTLPEEGIAAGCADSPIDASTSQTVEIVMNPRPE
ncbi:MAG: hypothetical protein RMA76_32365 [Deltaproteobacteria bacterium]